MLGSGGIVAPRSHILRTGLFGGLDLIPSIGFKGDTEVIGLFIKIRRGER